MTKRLFKTSAIQIAVLLLGSSCQPTAKVGKTSGLKYVEEFFEIDLRTATIRQCVSDSWYEGKSGFTFDGYCYYIFEWSDDCQFQLKDQPNPDFERGFSSMVSQITREDASFDFSSEYQWYCCEWFYDTKSTNPTIILDSLNRLCLCRFVETNELHVTYQKF